jgi:subtilase family serine protease
MTSLRRDGSRLTGTFRVADTGDLAVSRAVLLVRDNGVVVRRIAVALGAGDSASRTFHFRGDRGRNVVIGQVDPRNRVAESDESDNTVRRTIRVR